MNILVKFPTRERPHKWFLCIKNYIDLQGTGLVQYLITLDTNDPQLAVYVSYCEKLKEQGVNIRWITGESTGKINACNRDLERSGYWDILMLASDDMICQVKNWDLIILSAMESYYPDTDGVLHFSDGFAKEKLNTMCILGREYYKRFGYIYHPDYISLWCDNEFMLVSQKLEKVRYFDQVLFKHEHPSNTTAGLNDELMKRNESYYHKDQITYENRKAANFNIKV